MSKFLSGVVVGATATFFAISWAFGTKTKLDEAHESQTRRTPHYKGGYTAILETRDEANALVHAVEALIETQGHASVTEVAMFLGTTSNYQDAQLGWTTSDGIVMEKGFNNFLIEFPKPDLIP